MTPQDAEFSGLRSDQWVQQVLPTFFPSEFAGFHLDYWRWIDQIGADEPPQPWFSMWGRGLAKSTNAEAGPVYLAAKKLRRYWLYVCGTQQQADDHVGTIASMLETSVIERAYPALSAPKVGKHGNQKGWRRNRVWTQGGFVVDALGMDSAVRGAKLEEQRPEGVVFDDVDDRNDNPDMVRRKEGQIGAAILPALTSNAVVIVAQNYTHRNSIGARLQDRRAEFLRNRILSGPIPAVDGMKAVTNPEFNETDPTSPTHRITEGTPMWPAGMSIPEAEMRITRVGLHFFETESNNKRGDTKGALWDSKLLDDTRWEMRPPNLNRVAVGVDPNKTGRADDAGVVTAATAVIDGVLHGFVIADSSETSKPSEWRDLAANDYLLHGAGCYVVERTGLGEHARLTLEGAPAHRNVPPTVQEVDAKLGKDDRARPIARLWRDQRIHIVGHLHYLEQQLTSWVPGKGKSPGALDAMVHVLTHLLIDTRTQLEDELPPQDFGDGMDWSARP